ncbi:GNAT family N-acetyltransferase [Rhodoferax mekongensis]|uniref:GNAT family N-acetyltransferase n=1 Tax=Rhodoferax mekongensis TaxID=3068341 RepID=UPI0028BE3BF7|nr:GNAT family N-acetyltransferase [Rhodoferax sp. TBRC 17199]MDT7515907.1 GNAT family N-acetyltransferase [Rhodoferax sp. TBRC 17199]
MGSTDYVIRVSATPSEVDSRAWDALLATQAHPTPFMRHAYLAAMAESGSATAATGWSAHFITLHRGDALCAACVVYLKDQSYGEYVFDWAWASAYQQHGLEYYPKAVIAVPFTPVPGTRLLAVDAQARAALLQAVQAWCESVNVSSAHMLFAADADMQSATDAAWMARHTVQFHWHNTTPGYADFDQFLQSMNQEKRKKIKQERRKVAEAGVTFRHSQGADISAADWGFFYRCYAQTYREHGNPPYLTPDFFRRMAATMPEHWLLFVAERGGKSIASSLIAVGARSTGATGLFDTEDRVAYGRYWGAVEHVDCLHFEACYYQPLQWCIANGYRRFEGGAQGEHKMARALLPVKTSSAHWLQHPAFADAVQRFLEREGEGIQNYLEHLEQRTPLKKPV